MLTGAQTITTEVQPVPPLRFHPAMPVEDVVVSPRRRVYLAVKGMVEWLVALGLVVTTAPLVVVLSVMIKLNSRGPAFYAQTRLGRNGKAYRIFKLRTMVHNAEAGTGPVWAAKNDCRVTGLGRILRSTHLDELPQLLNVLRGEMGLIGPRPERPEIASRIEQDLPYYRNRLALRPGITGLAQMLAPADDPRDPKLRSVRRKLAHDLFYIREVNASLDLRIALSTACYFTASAVESLCKSFVRAPGKAVKIEMADLLPEDDA
jgi:lipopolysaccharide/colanic/teichoic acid biosynthesis glycosyltransferase